MASHLQQVGQRCFMVQQLVGGHRVQVLRQVALQPRQQPLAPYLRARSGSDWACSLGSIEPWSMLSLQMLK